MCTTIQLDGYLERHDVLSLEEEEHVLPVEGSFVPVEVQRAPGEVSHAVIHRLYSCSLGGRGEILRWQRWRKNSDALIQYMYNTGNRGSDWFIIM